MILLLKLLLAHFMGDFLLQPSSWVASKESLKIRSRHFYCHIFIHGALVALLLWNKQSWLWALCVMPIHGAIDLLKLYVQKPTNKTRWFVWDQVLHVISLVLLWMLLAHPSITLAKIWNTPIIWLFATALLFITAVSGIMIQVLMSGWTKDLDDPKDHSLLNAGKYIGLLERTLAFVFIVIGHWEAVGFLLTAKSVFRFGDLKDAQNRKMTEYVLIGTLLSFGVAILTGIAVSKLQPLLLK